MIYSWNPFRIQKLKVSRNEESFFAYDWSSVREDFSVQPWSTILFISRIQGPHNCKVFFTLLCGILINSSIILIRLWNGSILINYRWLGGIVVASDIMVNDGRTGLIILGGRREVINGVVNQGKGEEFPEYAYFVLLGFDS